MIASLPFIRLPRNGVAFCSSSPKSHSKGRRETRPPFILRPVAAQNAACGDCPARRICARSKHKDRTAGACVRNKEYLNRAWSRKGNSNAKWYNICNKRGVNWRNDLKNYSRELIENPYILLFYRFCLYFSSKRLLEILE